MPCFDSLKILLVSTNNLNCYMVNATYNNIKTEYVRKMWLFLFYQSHRISNHGILKIIHTALLDEVWT